MLSIVADDGSIPDRLLDPGLDGMVPPLYADAPIRQLAPEQTSGRDGGEGATGNYGSARFPRRVTFLPSAPDLVDSALHLVVVLALATVGGADGVSVSLRRNGRLATVAASDQTILDMDAEQYSTGEGPCVDASVNGRWFHSESLDGETRWPAFTPRARTLGINAILSSPLLAREQPIGALNIYSRTHRAFGPQDQQIASEFASEASSVLTVAGAEVTDDQLSRRLSEALRTRRLLAQAEGVLMERLGIAEDHAYAVMCRSSVRSSRALREEARDIVASTRPIEVETNNGRGAHRDD